MIINTPADERLVRRSAAAGTIAPIWFWATLIVLAVLHGTIDVSGHQLLRFGWLMYVGFFAYGSLTLFYVWGLRRRIPRRRRSTRRDRGTGPVGLRTAARHLHDGSRAGTAAVVARVAALHRVAAREPGTDRRVAVVRRRRVGRYPVAARWDRCRYLGRRGGSRGLPADLAGGGLRTVVWTGLDADIVLIGSWQIVTSRRLARFGAGSRMGRQRRRSADNALTEDSVDRRWR